MVEKPLEFFGFKNLKGFSYYFYLPSFSLEQKKTFTDLITRHQGTRTLSLHPDSIIIIDSFKRFKSEDFIKEILSHAYLVLLYNCKNAKVSSTANPQPKCYYRCLHYQDLLHIINIFETREKIIEYLFEFGLPKEIDMNGLIAVLNSNDIYKKTLYHEFRLVNIKFINVNPSQYDIPLYMPDSHRECSLFCTYEEKNEIDRYYKHRKEKNKIEDSNEDILKLPQPIKENNYCQLCDVKYDSYKLHIESQVHIDRIKDNSDLFIGIVQTLKRIRAYWNHSIDAKTKDTNSISDEISIKSTQDRQESEIEKSKELLNTINHNDFLGNKHYISNDTYKYSDYHMNKKESRKKIKQMMKGKFVFFHKSHKNVYE